MILTPEWWPHNVESWIEVADNFSTQEIFDSSNWKQLPQGQSNHNYKLSLPHGSFFVQSVNSRNVQLLPNPEQRVSQLELSRFTKIKPWLVDCRVDNVHLKISKWFDSVDNTYLNFDDHRVIVHLANFLISLHSIDESLVKKSDVPTLDIKSHFICYYEKAVLLHPNKKDDFEVILKSAMKLSVEFNANKLCHNDLSPSNLLWNESEEKLKVIDWEYACLSDPYGDLASLLVNCQLNSEQQTDLLDLYSAGLSFNLSMPKLENMILLCQHLNDFWIALQD